MFSPISHVSRWLGFAVLYLLFAGQLTRDEGAIAAVLATFAAFAAHRQACGANRRFTPAAAHVGCWGRAAAGLGSASARVGAVLIRTVWSGGSPGRAIRAGFAHGGARDPAAAGRRATALLAASLAPDSFVVRAEPGRDEVLIHTIVPEGRPPDRSWLA